MIRDSVARMTIVAIAAAFAGSALAQDYRHITEARVFTRDHNPTVHHAQIDPMSNGNGLQKQYIEAHSDRFETRTITAATAPGKPMPTMIVVRNNDTTILLNPFVDYQNSSHHPFDSNFILSRAKNQHAVIRNRPYVIRGSELHYTQPADMEPADEPVNQDDPEMYVLAKPDFNHATADATETDTNAAAAADTDAAATTEAASDTEKPSNETAMPTAPAPQRTSQPQVVMAD